MNYNIENAIFKINKNSMSKDLINTLLQMEIKVGSIIFRIARYIGKGAIGNVYLLKILTLSKNIQDRSIQNKLYVIKIANRSTYDIYDEHYPSYIEATSHAEGS